MSSAWSGLRNDLEITELPHYAINSSLPEDSFFTNKVVVELCLDKFYNILKEYNINGNDYTFIEPSAGSGSFFDYLPDNSIGIDINPRSEKIIKGDFLRYYPKFNEARKYITIGNPPFGVRGAIALAFLNRALLFSDIVAFILPMSFYSNGKGSNMRRVENASLIYNEKLPDNSYYMPDTNKAVNVNTVFQIWKKGESNITFEDYDVSEYVDIYTCCSAPDRFCGLGKGRVYDGFIASTFYKDVVSLVDNFEDVLYGSGYGVIIKNNRDDILKILREADWSKYCSDATNHCHHIRMHHLRKLLYDNGFGKVKTPPVEKPSQVNTMLDI